MDAIVDLSWRIYPAAGVILAGVWLAVRGVQEYLVGTRRPLKEPGKALVMMQGFRLTIFGLVVAGVGAAWAWQIGWLLALSLAIGFEEMLECSICVYALRRAPRVEAEFKRQRAALATPGPQAD